MAYYRENFYGGDSGEFYQTPSYIATYDIVPFQDPITYSSHEYSEPGFADYSSTAYSNDYEPFLSISDISYSTQSVPESKLIEYNPDSYDTSYFSSGAHYVASYSTKSEFDDNEFEEYDPTPYGGGYDPTLTYGRPLSPSDEICYPRSEPESNNTLSLDNFWFESILSPYGKNEVDEYSEKPHTGTEETKATEEPKPPEEPLLEPSPDEPVKDDTWDDAYPWSGYGYWVGNGRNEDCECRNGCDKKVDQTPYGYGADCVELCESLFGYWPCLSKYNRKNNYGDEEGGIEERKENQWMGDAGYIFESLCGNDGDYAADNYGGPYNYEKNYPEHYY